MVFRYSWIHNQKSRLPTWIETSFTTIYQYTSNHFLDRLVKGIWHSLITSSCSAFSEATHEIKIYHLCRMQRLKLLIRMSSSITDKKSVLSASLLPSNVQNVILKKEGHAQAILELLLWGSYNRVNCQITSATFPVKDFSCTMKDNIKCIYLLTFMYYLLASYKTAEIMLKI